MQVVCGNCQLNFQAPDGATGLVCPICRSPLRPAQASAESAANKSILEWDGGALDDLMAILTAPALAVRVEVIAAANDTPMGEVHLLAGGVSEAIYNGSNSNDALDKLRSVTPARFRIEPRLPNPTDGDLTYPGPDSGTLDARPLAHLMRYCEQYVITAAIDVWRGNETARVDYRKGEISGVTVGGIDAPERLAEVMRWSSGNYRLVVPRLTLPEVVPVAPPKPAAPPPPEPAVAWAPTPAGRAAAPSSGAANKTIFGMPVPDAATIRAMEAANAAATAATSASAAPSISAAPALAAPAPASAAAPAAMARESQHPSKTIFGVPAPVIPVPAATAPAATAAPVEKPAPARDTASRASAPSKQERKRGARKTTVPPPEIIPPSPSASSPPVAEVASMSAATTAAQLAATAAAPAAASTLLAPSTGGARRDTGAPEVVLTRPPVTDDKTSRVVQRRPSRREAPIWTYVGVGFTFGLVLLGIYRLVGALAH
ncbi:MAG TPA: hypothetical protein VFH73_25060 [Polyangia bacterium]|jgi:hypothetical protein|nr:hypothetical protein [Polyangia bacterium]